MKFKNLTTGVVLETNNEWTIKQIKGSENYKEIKELKSKDEPKETKTKNK